MGFGDYISLKPCTFTLLTYHGQCIRTLEPTLVATTEPPADWEYWMTNLVYGVVIVTFLLLRPLAYMLRSFWLWLFVLFVCWLWWQVRFGYRQLWYDHHAFGENDTFLFLDDDTLDLIQSVDGETSFDEALEPAVADEKGFPGLEPDMGEDGEAIRDWDDFDFDNEYMCDWGIMGGPHSLAYEYYFLWDMLDDPEPNPICGGELGYDFNERFGYGIGPHISSRFRVLRYACDYVKYAPDEWIGERSEWGGLFEGIYDDYPRMYKNIDKNIWRNRYDHVWDDFLDTELGEGEHYRGTSYMGEPAFAFNTSEDMGIEEWGVEMY